MTSKRQALENSRNNRKATAEKVGIKPKIKQYVDSFIKQTGGGLTGQDKINQLILQQIAKLQNTVTDQIATLAIEYGISDIETGDPKITIPSPNTPTEALNLPEIPPQANVDTKILSITPQPLRIAELNKISEVIQEQFTNQLLPYEYETQNEQLKEEALLRARGLAKELTLSYLEKNKPPFCLPPAIAKKQRDKLNSLLGIVETTATALNFTSEGLNVLTLVVNGTITAIEGLTLTKFTANQAAKAIPLIPGVIVSLLEDLDTIITSFKETPIGDRRITKVRDQLQTGAFYISIASAIMDAIATILNIFISLLKACGETPNELGPQTKKLIELNQTTLSSNTQQSYKGFTFQIIQRPLPSDPKIQRNVAQALNTEGIVVLESQPSFTDNPKVLIEELKLIIDRDNLKAY